MNNPRHVQSFRIARAVGMSGKALIADLGRVEVQCKVLFALGVEAEARHPAMYLHLHILRKRFRELDTLLFLALAEVEGAVKEQRFLSVGFGFKPGEFGVVDQLSLLVGVPCLDQWGDDVVVIGEDSRGDVDRLLLEMVFGLVIEVNRLEASCYL